MAPYNVLNKNKILRAGLFERVSIQSIRSDLKYIIEREDNQTS